MSKGDCIVRDGCLKDWPRLIELLKATDLFWETGDSEESFAKKIAHDPGSIIVLEWEDKIIGMIVTVYDPWASFIWHLAIDPKFQGHGFGHLLAEEAENRLKARGTTSVNGYVVSTNRNSLTFLKKRGYSQSPLNLVLVEKVFNKKE